MLEEFKRYLKIKGLADATITAYMTGIKQFKSYIQKSLRNANLRDIDDFIWFYRGKGSKNTTLNLKLNAIKRFYKWLKRTEEVSYDIERILEYESLPTKDVERQIIDEGQIRLLLDMVDEPRDKAMIAILFNCGLRVSELQGLKKHNFIDKIDEKGYVVVKIVRSKNDKNRNVYMTPYYYQFVKDYMYSHHNPQSKVFTRLDSPTEPLVNLKTMIERVKKLTKEILGVELTPHDFRASCFTHLYRKGVDIYSIAELAGHSSIETTRGYIQADEQDVVSKTLGAFQSEDLTNDDE